MFTGIVEELGRVGERHDHGDGASFRFEAPLVSADAGLGDSIAVNGCCLTVTEVGDGWWRADAVAETLARTNLASLRAGDVVNFERPVRLSDRLGGHLVQGHVDAVGTIVAPAPDLAVDVPDGLHRYIVEKGSITVDGCSLTVVKPTGTGFTIAVIPHTMAVTTLGFKGVGSEVNIECDMLAKHVRKLFKNLTIEL